jgi:hypothetical protein
MKKTLLSVFAIALMSGSAFSQAFTDGATSFTESYGTAGTSCLKGFTNAGYQWADGNITSATNNADRMAITAVASPAGGVAPGLFDFYFTDGANCNPMRNPAQVGVDLSGTGSAVMVVRAKASASGATVQFHLASTTGTNYPASTTASIAVNTSITEKTLTTSYADYTVAFGTSTEFTGWAGRSAVNVWGLLIPNGNANNNGVVIEIESISISMSASNSSAQVDNSAINLFPNPSNGAVNVDLSQFSGASNVVVMNNAGQTVATYTAEGTLVIPAGTLNKGMYLVQVSNENKVATKKLVIE